MSLFLIGSDIYGLKKHLTRRRWANHHLGEPDFLVIIPAFNEQNTILSTIKSVLKSKYPKPRLRIVVVNDGSTDQTAALVDHFIKTEKSSNVFLISQPNSGKAAALNTALKEIQFGDLFMTLDADSYLDENALANVVKHFENRKVKALASNVKIIKRGGLLNLIQKFEYLVSYQMKKSQTVFNIEYIIGGVGASFRRSFIKKIGYFDTNTVTEDIDLTMKILQLGNKENRVIYADDVITYTEAVLNLPGLIRQRFRWKFGRTQTFYKNKNLFFNRDKKFNKGLTWIYLPYAVYADLVFFLEPLIVAYIAILLLVNHDILTFATAVTVISLYNLLNILAEETTSLKEKLVLASLVPVIYPLFYILSLVEYIALVKTAIKVKTIPESVNYQSHTWQPVERPMVSPESAHG